MKPYRGPPMTLGNAAAAGVRLVVWCRDCGRQVEPDPGEMAERYGPDMTVPDWQARLVCSGCGSRQVEFVGTEPSDVERIGASNAKPVDTRRGAPLTLPLGAHDPAATAAGHPAGPTRPRPQICNMFWLTYDTSPIEADLPAPVADARRRS
jgi:hypothetical protein